MSDRLTDDEFQRIGDMVIDGTAPEWVGIHLKNAVKIYSEAKRARESEQRFLKAARRISEEVYGCVFCDSGVLRKSADARGQGHDPECGFAQLRAARYGTGTP